MRLRFDLNESHLAAYRVHLERLTAGKGLGLTSLSDPGEIERRHFLEPLALLSALEEANAFATPAIDIGTGAGFPGLPIKIVRPQLELTLLEANGKKIGFLRELLGALGISGVTVVHARAEEAGRDPAHRARYALAMARAVAPLRVLVELALPLLSVGGRLAAPKGSRAPAEVRDAEGALRACGGEIELVRRLEAVGPGASPVLVLVRKVAATPERYPRRPGIPAKRPL